MIGGTSLFEEAGEGCVLGVVRVLFGVQRVPGSGTHAGVQLTLCN